MSLGDEIAPARKEKAIEQVAAFTWLLNHFARLRTKHLHRAFARWSEWEAHDVSGKLRTEINNQKPALPEAATQLEPAPEPVAETGTTPLTAPENQMTGEQMRQAL